MKMSTLSVLLFGVLALLPMSTVYAQSGLNPDAEPNFGSKFLRAGFTPDPFTAEVRSGGPISIGDELSGSECAGYATSSPDFNINWNGGGNELTFFFVSEGDTTMALYDSSGYWYCDDDFGNTNDPLISLANPSAGTYSVWIGSYSEGESHAGLLYVTEQSDTPENFGASGAVGDSAVYGDTDRDGVLDEVELYLAQSFMPTFEYDEEEHDILTAEMPIREFSEVVFLYQVSPAKCGVKAANGLIRFYLEPLDTNVDLPEWIVNTESFLLTVVPTYEYDYVPYDPISGPEEDLLAHYGDTERVRICIALENENYAVRFVMLNRHGESVSYTSDEVDWDPASNSHPYLYVSEGKHATFASGDECEDSVSGGEWLGWDEDCSDGIVIHPTVNEGLNVGEWASGDLVTTEDLGELRLANLFPQEAVWSFQAADKNHRDSYFCGGYEVAEYNEMHDIVNPFYEWEWCGGGLDGKWLKQTY